VKAAKPGTRPVLRPQLTDFRFKNRAYARFWSFPHRPLTEAPHGSPAIKTNGES